MYICICNGHRDQDIRAAAATGMRCPRSIYAHLGKPARCGRCLDTATRVIEEVHAEQAPALGANDDPEAGGGGPVPEAAG